VVDRQAGDTGGAETVEATGEIVAVAEPSPAATATTPVAADDSVGWPVTGPITQGFGWSHHGLDIQTAHGTPVVASAAGEVACMGATAIYGNYVLIRHGILETLYAHLSEVWVFEGQTVGAGQGIGAIGCTGWCTGPHLHFEVHKDGIRVDPLAYLGAMP